MGNGTKINKKRKWLKRILITLVLVAGFIVFYWYMYQTRTRQIESKRLNFRYDRKIPNYFSVAGAP